MSTRHILATAILGLLAACQAPIGEREENLGPHVHRLTVDLAGEVPAETRLAKAAGLLCPAGYDRQDDETMPPAAPAYRVWLVRCR